MQADMLIKKVPILWLCFHLPGLLPAIVPKEDSLQFSLAQFIEIQPEEFRARFVAAFGQTGGISLWQIRESSGESSHQGWGSHIALKGRHWGEEHLSAT